MGFRPQHCVLDHDAKQLRAQIAVREYLGERVVFSLRAENVRFKAVADPTSKWKVGDQVGCKISAEHLLIFDQQSTKRIATNGHAHSGV